VIVAGGLAALVLTLALVRGVPLRPSLAAAPCRELLRYALPFALAAAVGAIYFRLALVLVDSLADETQTGYFGASFRVIEVLLVVPQLAVQTAFPIFARSASNDHERLRYGLGKTLDVALLIGVLVAVGLSVGAPFVIEVVAGPGFEPAADVLRLQSLAFVGSFAAAVFGYALLSVHGTRGVLAMNAAALVAMAVLGAILVPLHGAEGAAVATVLCELLLALVGGVFLARHGAVGALRLTIIPRLVVAAAAGVGAHALLGLPALPGSIVAMVVCAAVALLLRAVPDELMVEARSAWVRLRAWRGGGTPT
jgi:O-antigen/teichoic acid export membrane protein